MALSFHSVFVLISGALFARDRYCPPLGPVLPAPTNQGASKTVQAATDAVSPSLSNKNSGSDWNLSALSVAVEAIYECGPLLEVHHTPTYLDLSGIKQVDANTGVSHRKPV